MALFIMQGVKPQFNTEMRMVIVALRDLYFRYSEDLLIIGSESPNSVTFRAGSRSNGDVYQAVKAAGFPETKFDLDVLEPYVRRLTYVPKRKPKGD